MQRLNLFLPLIIFVVVAGFFFITVKRIDQGEYSPQTLPSALLDRVLPTFNLPRLEQLEDRVTLQHLIGKIALINVWATWCPSCHVEHGYLNYLAKEKGVVIYGINYKDKAELANQWLQQKGNPYQLNIFDREGRLGLGHGRYRSARNLCNRSSWLCSSALSRALK